MTLEGWSEMTLLELLGALLLRRKKTSEAEESRGDLEDLAPWGINVEHPRLRALKFKH